MSRRFFTADWHLDDMDIISLSKRPFKAIGEMKDTLIERCNEMAAPEDYVIHLGDFAIYGKKNGQINSKTNPVDFASRINATFINVKGNHDDSNKVKSLCSSLRTTLGKNFWMFHVRIIHLMYLKYLLRFRVMYICVVMSTGNSKN